jgi:hypothetical protein
MLTGRPNVMHIPASVQEFPGDNEFVGSNPPSGAQITYYLKKRHLFGDLKLEVLDRDGKVLSTMPGGKRPGINRVSWPMRSKPPKVPPASSLVPQFFSFIGPRVSAGSYTVRMTKGKKTYDGRVTLVPDSRAGYSVEDMALQDTTVHRLYDMLGRLTYTVDTLLDAQKQLKNRKAGLDEDGAVQGQDPSSTLLKKMNDDLEDFRKTIVATRKGGFLAGDEQLREKLGGLYGAVNGYEGRPTNSQLQYMEVLESKLYDAETRLGELLGGPLDALNVQLRQAALDPIKRLTQSEWEAR